uniref:Arf-GAP domain-containing protein n=1 Tax=Panagrolaimus sp. JU765 TaxID=591449 RepID=A0AC34RST5_9BILA
MSTTNAQKKKQEERNSKLIRELAALPANKYCFECGQRGPTYVNITNGSFCCMHCSGLLRGLNPPHRVKSISMATFSNEEVEKLQTMGNEENARIWLGLHDGPVKFEPVRLDENVKHHLVLKYENRKWYVSPSEIAEQRKLLEAHTRRDSVSGLSVNSHKSNQSAPANLLQSTEKKNDIVDFLGDDLMFPVREESYSSQNSVKSVPPFTTFQSSPAFPLSSHSSVPQPLQFDLFAQQQQKQQQQPQPNLFGTDFFKAQASPPKAIPKPQENFADFDSVFGNLSVSEKPNAQASPPKAIPKPQENFADFDSVFGNLSVSEKPNVQNPPLQPMKPVSPPQSNGFLDLSTPELPKPAVQVAPPVLEPVKTERKDDGPDYSALNALYTVEDEPIDFFGFGTTKKATNDEPIDFFGFGTTKKSTNGLSSNPTLANSNGFAKSSTIGDFTGTPPAFPATSGAPLGLTPNPFFSMNSFNQQPAQQSRAPWEPPASNPNQAAHLSSNWNPFS